MSETDGISMPSDNGAEYQVFQPTDACSTHQNSAVAMERLLDNVIDATGFFDLGSDADGAFAKA
jgi:hypothetical protein